jgi:hypothetical protein
MGTGWTRPLLPLHSKSYDHVARTCPNRRAGCLSIADRCPYWIYDSALEAMVDGRRDGFRYTHRGRDHSHRGIDLTCSEFISPQFSNEQDAGPSPLRGAPAFSARQSMPQRHSEYW